MNRKITFLILFLATSFIFQKPAFAAQLEISLPYTLNNLPIRTPQIGSAAIQCYTGDNRNNEWIIFQGKNEQSLCLDTNNAPDVPQCAEADIARETSTTQMCYWKNQKKFYFATNSQNFTNEGCSANAGTLANEPGGYGVTLLESRPNMSNSDWPSPKYTLGNLDKLILSVSFSNDYYNFDHTNNGCPPGINDPLAGRVPIGMDNIAVLTNKFDPNKANDPVSGWGSLGTQFYTVSLYDNRDSMRLPGAGFVDCKLPTTSGAGFFINAADPVAFYGLSPNLPGQGLKQYDIDVLPRIKHYLTQCLGNVDFNTIRVSGMLFGQELQNTVIMGTTYINPKLTLVYKDGFNPSISNTNSIGDLNSDGKVDINDYNIMVRDFGHPYTIFDYNELVANFGK